MIKKPNVIFLVLICVFVVVEIVVLRPTSIEKGEDANTGMFKSIESMVNAQKADDEVGYTIDGFHYTAVEGEKKHWELTAKTAVLYEKSKLVRASHAVIRMFDALGKITLIEGDEADYRMGQRDMDMIGNVKVTFPDKFWLKTQRAHYDSNSGKISSAEPVYGEAMQPAKNGKSSGELMQMWGTGFNSGKNEPEILVHANAHVRMRRLSNDEITDVKSDRARLDRFAKIAYFSMVAPTDFVDSHQGTLRVRSKRQEATYDSDTSVLKYMTAFEQVLIKETDRKQGGLNYATAEKAEFMTQEDKIILSGFPSAYQEHDTLTGELITIYRTKNLVEVSQANAFHDGTQPDDERAEDTGQRKEQQQRPRR